MTTEAQEIKKEDSVDPKVVILSRVPSMSNPKKEYEIRLGIGGTVYCTCPAWRFQKRPVEERSCKHLVRWYDENGG